MQGDAEAGGEVADGRGAERVDDEGPVGLGVHRPSRLDDAATVSGSGFGVRTRTDARELWARKSATG